MIHLDKAASDLEKYKWILILLPGITAAGTLSLISSSVLRLTEIQVVIVGALISLPIFLLSSIAIFFSIHVWRGVVWIFEPYTKLAASDVRVSIGTFHAWSLSLALLVSPMVGVQLSVLLERDAFHAAARRLNILRYFTDPRTRSNWHLDAESIWSPLEQLLFANTRSELGNNSGRLHAPLDSRFVPSISGYAYFEVQLKTNQIFVGWPRLYGRRGSETELFLSPACTVSYHNDSRTVQFIRGPGVVIKEREIIAVRLLDSEPNCPNLPEPSFGGGP